MKRPAPATIRLTETEIETLNQLAAQVGSVARTGPTAGTPSWRTLVKDIANHRVSISSGVRPKASTIR